MTTEIDNKTRALSDAHADWSLAALTVDRIAEAIDAYDKAQPLTFDNDSKHARRKALLSQLERAGNRLAKAKEAHARALQDCANAWVAV